MVYAQFASGYKAGGNNARPFYPSQSHAFAPEELVSYEGGIKSTWHNNLRVNAAVFWNDYTNIQLPQTVCSWAPPLEQVPCASQDNVGDANVWGIELEGEWHPTERWSVDASYSHLGFDYTRVEATSVVKKGMISPYTPENKWSIGAQYEYPLQSLGSLVGRLDANYQDSIYADANNRPTNFIPARTLLNARLTWRSPDENWEIAAEFTNLTDEYYYLTKFDLSSNASGYVDGQPGRPMEWAVNIKRRF